MLRERIEAAFAETLADVELLVPYSEGGRLHELHEVAGELERTEREDGVLVHARVPVAELYRFDDLGTNGDGARVLSSAARLGVSAVRAPEGLARLKEGRRCPRGRTMGMPGSICTPARRRISGRGRGGALGPG